MSDINWYDKCQTAEAELLLARAENKRLRALASALLAAARDVQEHWSDPGSYTHNRLLTPMLVHDDTIRTLAGEQEKVG